MLMTIGDLYLLFYYLRSNIYDWLQAISVSILVEIFKFLQLTLGFWLKFLHDVSALQNLIFVKFSLLPGDFIFFTLVDVISKIFMQNAEVV